MSLWQLAGFGNAACLRALLDTGVDVNVPDKPDMTALMLAAHKGHDACLTMLLERGAGVNAHTIGGFTALMLAALKGHDACMGILLRRGADVNMQNKKGKTALMFAASIGRDAMICQLVKAGDRSWEYVPTPCVGLERALLSIYTNAPQDLPELFRRLEPRIQKIVQNTLRVLHGFVNEEALRIDILVRVLDASNG